MSNLNWPEGATHYLQAGEEHTRFRDLSGDQWKYFNSYTGEWTQHRFSSEDLLRRHDLIPRPKPKQWSGPEDGLPPVGERVDYMGEHCTVVAHVMERNEKGAILQGADDWFYGTEITIDPIRTAADIAAEKRETAIRELMDIAQVDCRVTAAKLVDAGFKR